MQLPERVTVCEALPTRLRYLPHTVPTHEKLKLIWVLAAAGLREIEASAFVHPRLVPGLADAEAVFAELPRRPGLRYACYVPNVRGARRALLAGADEIRAVFCLSDAVNLRLTGMTMLESLREVERIVPVVREAAAGRAVKVTAHLGCAFDAELSRVVEYARLYRDLGLDGALLTDPEGAAQPVTVHRVSVAVQEAAPELELCLRLYDTQGFGLANLLAGLQAGVTRFDASAGGVGGVASQPGRRGNIATEEAVALCHAMGIETGVDLPALAEAARQAREVAGRWGSLPPPAQAGALPS